MMSLKVSILHSIPYWRVVAVTEFENFPTRRFSVTAATWNVQLVLEASPVTFALPGSRGSPGRERWLICLVSFPVSQYWTWGMGEPTFKLNNYNNR